jgi:hypothetical protein
MPTSLSVNTVWNDWVCGHSAGTRSIDVNWLKSEKITEKLILPRLGFTYVVRFSGFSLRKGTMHRVFSYDIYAERGKERWLIDVTVQAHKVLEIPMMRVLRRMGITNFGAVMINKDFNKYVFKEATEKDNQKTLTLRVNVEDFVLGNVKTIPKNYYIIVGKENNG